MRRILAAGLLLVWLGAQGLCVAHCSLGLSHGGSGAPPCHAASTSQAPAQDHDASPPTQAGTLAGIACATLKSASVARDATMPVPPEFPLLYMLAPPALAIDVIEPQPASQVSCQAKSREWIFAPEVCLGPAFRSLAPPRAG